MVIQMTNRLLATVITFAVSSGLAAHAAQDPHRSLPTVNLPKVALPALTVPRVTLASGSAPRPTAPATSLAKLTLPAATTVPQAVQAAANHISDVATAAVDPSAAVRSAFQRDLVALEHLRQTSALKGEAHTAFNQRISRDEATLVEVEKIALASKRSASASIGTMDGLVSAAKADLAKRLAQPTGEKIGGDNHQSND